jgi:hypothetical protein
MDYEFNPGEIVTVVNRSSQPVEWRFNGVSYRLEPHQKKAMNLTYALYGIRRNPVMGTFDPAYEYQHVSLLGIAEMEDTYPCSPIEQSDAVESIDRSKLPADRQDVELVKVGWGTEERALAGRNPLSPDAGFAGVMPSKD